MKRVKCPGFSCLEYNAQKCERYKACDGCFYHYACSVCSKQETIVNDQRISCDLKSLPAPCRFCNTRNTSSFSPSDCLTCTSLRPRKHKL